MRFSHLSKVRKIATGFLLIIFLTSCSSSTATISQEVLDEAASDMSNTLSTQFSVSEQKAFQNGDNITIEIWLDSQTNVALFGNAVFDCVQAVPTIENDMSVSISEVIVHLTDSSGNPVLDFTASPERKLGTLTETRKTGVKTATYSTFDELEDTFPALKIHRAERNSLSDDELKIYNEVWAALDAEPNRPEEEIFAELAPNYGMTADELCTFIEEAMMKVYF